LLGVVLLSPAKITHVAALCRATSSTGNLLSASYLLKNDSPYYFVGKCSGFYHSSNLLQQLLQLNFGSTKTRVDSAGEKYGVV